MRKKDSIKNTQPETSKVYHYIPDLLDFGLGAIYLQRWTGTGGWRETILNESCYDMSLGHCEFMSIVSQVKWTRGELYRIKFLDGNDIEALGFEKDVTKGHWILHNCKIILDWSSKCNIKVYVDDDVVFNGKLLNMFELKQILIYIGILADASRSLKFKQYGNSIE